MRKFIIIMFGALFPLLSVAQVGKARVDEIYEMSSIVWKLAGAEAYNNCRWTSYNEDVDAYFGKYADHELMAFCRQLLAERGISYDAVHNAAVFLSKDGKGRIGIYPGYTAQSLVDRDDRWTAEAYERYAELFDKFYRDTDFNKFFFAHSEAYKSLAAKVDKALGEQINTGWFEDFYGRDFPSMDLVVCAGCGPGNYGSSPDYPKDRNIFCVGVSGEDAEGNPVLSRRIYHTAIHEITHYFANPLIDSYFDSFGKDALEKMYAYSEEAFYYEAMAPETIPYEWLTRLSVLLYFRDNGEKQMEYDIGLEMRRGFIWMKQSYEFMDSFYGKRSEYKHLADFMPELVGFFNDVAADFGTVVREYENMTPYITEITPAPGSAIDMSADTVTFTIRFSQDMNKSSSTRILLENFDKDVDFADYGMGQYGIVFWQDSRTFVEKFPTRFMKDMKMFGLELYGKHFQNVYGFPLGYKYTYDCGY